MLFDKTGTLTVGTPDVREIVTRSGLEAGEILRLAASVDRLSPHVLGRALVDAAGKAGLAADSARRYSGGSGPGHCGTIDGQCVLVDSRAFLHAARVPDDEIASTLTSTRKKIVDLAVILNALRALRG